MHPFPYSIGSFRSLTRSVTPNCAQQVGDVQHMFGGCRKDLKVAEWGGPRYLCGFTTPGSNVILARQRVLTGRVSQIRTVESPEPLAKRVPSGEKASE